MKTVAKINPENEYESAKQIIASLGCGKSTSNGADLKNLDESVDNLKTVINVLMERLSPPKKQNPPKNNKDKDKDKNPKERTEFKKLPSERFPNLEVEENIVPAEVTPVCKCCNKEMTESGMYKTSEKVEVIPKRYYIVRNKRVIYNCKHCNGSLETAPCVPSISACSNYGDSMFIDVALSKYCDLIPIERYSAIAARNGLVNLAPNSLIGITHILADFLYVVYERIKEKEVLNNLIVHADETPHKMLEGSETMNWYLWGFFTSKASIFEAHDTRSGDIPLDFLKNSKAKYLVTDGYSGYQKAIRLLDENYGIKMSEVLCNAHAYRYFKDASKTWEGECKPVLELYGDIYKLERESTAETKAANRLKMKPLFEKIKDHCEEKESEAMPGSQFEKAINYFKNRYASLTKCTDNPDLPLDNNLSERTIRSPVVGRKVWLGTHSKRGARTHVILFSIVESCKLNHINPRHYFPYVVKRILQNLDFLTPYEYAASIDSG